MNEQNKEKLIAHLEKGTEIFLVLNDDTGIIGVVERNVLCWEETDENWHELTVYVGGQHITINSNNVKEVRKCIPHTEDEHNQIQNWLKTVPEQQKRNLMIIIFLR